jgi:hypothetical protein
MPRRCLPALSVALAVTAVLGTAACEGGNEGRTGRGTSGRQGTEGRGAPHAGGQARARGVVTVAQADRLLDRYEQLANKANRTRDHALLAQAEAGNALERSRAGYEQHKALSRREQAESVRPFSYRHRAFHIPSGTNWFLATATRASHGPQGGAGASYDADEPSGEPHRSHEPRHYSQERHGQERHNQKGHSQKDHGQRRQNHRALQPHHPRKPNAPHQRDALPAASAANSAAKPSSAATSRPSSVLVFVKGDGRWRLRVVLELQTGRLPRIARNAEGVATAVPTAVKRGKLSADDIPAAYEDLWQTGGKKEGTGLAANPVTREARSTYRSRDDALGAQGARKRFVPRAPRYDDSYALRTADGGVLALVPLAHEQRLRVTRPGLQITPSAEEAVYAPAPRTAILTTFHGQALAQLPRRGLPVVLAAKYALVGSR